MKTIIHVLIIAIMTIAVGCEPPMTPQEKVREYVRKNLEISQIRNYDPNMHIPEDATLEELEELKEITYEIYNIKQDRELRRIEVKLNYIKNKRL